MARFQRTSSSFARLHPVSECQMAWDGSSRKAYTERINPDPYGRRPSALGCTRTTPNISKLERTMRLRDARIRAPINLDGLRGLKIEKNGKIIIMIMNTDDMLIAYSDNSRELVDSFEKKLNNSFEATPRSQIEHHVGMHVHYDQLKGLLTLDARRHLYGFINHMGLDPNLDVGVSTPLDPHEVYSKANSPPEIDVKLRHKV